MQGQHSDYYLVYLRVNGCYFWFNVFQILASVLLIVLLLQERYHLAAIVEIFIAFLVALDLYRLCHAASSATSRRARRSSPRAGTTA